MSEDYTQFRGIEHYGTPLLSVELENNLKSYLDWAFLRIGAWHNVNVPTTGIYGGNFHTLHEVNDRNYSDGQVYQGIRKDWIWETGVNYTDPTGGQNNPLDVEVYIDGNLRGTGDSGFEHHINYPLGRVVFDNSQDGSTIAAQYSFRAVQVYLADDINWWFEVQPGTFNPSNIQWSQNLSSGDYSISSANRMQMPCIVIEPVIRTNSKPYELGTLTAKNETDIIFHVIAETRYERNNIADILRLQKDKTIILYNTIAIHSSNKFPLDERGMKVDNPTMYPDIINDPNLVFRAATFNKIIVNEVKTDNPRLHWSRVQATIEIIY